jgi:hypothetical protein
MKKDEMRIEILEDGTIKFETDSVSMPNHTNAEQFLREVGRLAGGTTERKKRTGHHHHGHSHSHGEGEHTHQH